MADDKKNVKTKRPTAKKRDLQNAKQRLHNRSFKSTVKTAIRSLEQGEKTDAQLSSVYSLIDKGVKMGIFKLNKASRMKGKFANRAKGAGS